MGWRSFGAGMTLRELSSVAPVQGEVGLAHDEELCGEALECDGEL